MDNRFSPVTEPSFTIEYRDLESVVNEQYGIDYYDFVADMETSNDTDHVFYVEKKDLTEYERADLDRFLTSDEHYITYTILQDLCNKGVVPEGNITVSVCW